MACGVPVISSDGGALPEVVGDAGIVVRAGDSQQLAHEIERVLNSPQLREDLALCGRERILSKFCWRVTAQNMVRLYRDILARHAESTELIEMHS